MPRITYGSVQTRRWLGFEAWQCAHSAVPAPVTVRHPRWTCTHAAFRALVMPNSGRCSLAWLSADPYIPVAVTIATAPSSLSRGHAERRLGVRVARPGSASKPVRIRVS
jgi:hypothetical protein